jgi:hypothetical protein
MHHFHNCHPWEPFRRNGIVDCAGALLDSMNIPLDLRNMLIFRGHVKLHQKSQIFNTYSFLGNYHSNLNDYYRRSNPRIPGELRDFSRFPAKNVFSSAPVSKSAVVMV